MTISKKKLAKDQATLDGLINSAKAAKIVGVSKNTLFSRMREGKLQALDLDGEFLFYEDEVHAYMDNS